ncbi:MULTISPECIES: hypothetical protein [Raoultella]|uniref:Uncharacterized protein n=1 Tax=Raoultella planticola TaxID=575 RepID=A0A485ATJ4_RAOPL|nr:MULTISPECIES: hypothetical protein [Raoultella]MCE9898216.1 hypothetical protein [Raoultella terrigena]VFS64917.1 Uncharacterised protein [Raoultella planticola]
MHDYINEIYQKVINKQSIDVRRFFAHLVDNFESFEPTWHALGFIHCRIAQNDQGTLRLHIWFGNNSHAAEQLEKIHDHKFSLNSYVLHGAICNEVFELIDASSRQYEYQAYAVKYLNNGSKLIPLDTYYNVGNVSTDIVRAGCYYTVDSKEFHRSTLVSSQMAISLVATFEHKNKDPLTLVSSGNNDLKIRDTVPFDKGEWVRILRSYMSKL